MKMPKMESKTKDDSVDQEQEVGFVKSVRNFLLTLDGLPTIHLNQILVNKEGTRALVNALYPNKIEALQLDEKSILPGELFSPLPTELKMEVSNHLLGRSINPLGIPIDGKGPIPQDKKPIFLELDKTAPGISYREFITNQFETGITMIDTLIPLGKGQRELILGDARTGKADFLINIITNQKGKNVICIYGAIGKPAASIREIIDILNVNQALSYSCVVATASSDPAPLILLTPHAALTVAEYFQSLGLDVLVILDDLGAHARIAREIALLANRLPGREAYPGDIFYQHSHLLERAGNFNQLAGKGSITALPMIELNLNDFTTYIPTNLMAMTDGHLLFKSNLYNRGLRPAVDVSLSISRVGQQTQGRLHNLLATRIKQVLAQAMELETISSFSTELPISSQIILSQKELLEELMQQPPLTNIPIPLQIVLLALPFTSFLQGKDRFFIKTQWQKMAQAFTTHPQLKIFLKLALSLKTDTELITRLESIKPILAQLCPPSNS